MNCVRWSMGDASLHGMGTSSVPGQCFGCYPCPWTKLLPMSPDRTVYHLTDDITMLVPRAVAPLPLHVSRVRFPIGEVWQKFFVRLFMGDGARSDHPRSIEFHGVDVAGGGRAASTRSGWSSLRPSTLR